MVKPTETPLANLRRKAGLSIRDLEAITGINRGRLSVIERGIPPSDDEAERILAALRRPHDIPAVIGSDLP